MVAPESILIVLPRAAPGRQRGLLGRPGVAILTGAMPLLRSFRFRCASCLLGLLAAFAAGCADDTDDAVAPTEPLQLTGVTEDARFAVAFVRSDDQAVAYVCGRDAESISLSRWLRGDVGEDGEARLVVPATGEVRGTVRFDEDGATASLELDDGTALHLAASPVAEGTPEGLYGAMDAGCRTGVIVRDGGAAIDGTWCSSAGLRMQVTPLRPMTVEDGALWVQVPVATQDGTPHTLLVRRVEPGAGQ